MTCRVWMGLLAGLLGGCGGYFMPNPPCPPPPSARFPTTETFSCEKPTVEPIEPMSSSVMPLCELVDLALLNSPRTRGSWYRAKEAATAVGTARGAYIPPVLFTATWLQNQLSQVNLNLEALNWEKQVSFGFSTSYLLYDFGGRNARLCAALAALSEANWLYNWDVQSVILSVAQSYYDYVSALGIYEANVANVEDFAKTAEIATAMREVGIQSMSDQLQAETQLYQAKIELEESKLNLDVAYATLVRSLGLPPDTKIQVAPLPETIETAGICGDMKYLMRVAKNHRADLMASRAVVQERREDVRIARSDFLPKLTTDVFGSRVSLNNLKFLSNYQVEFNIDVPLFSSFKDINDLRAAQAALFEAQAQLDDAELKAYLEVVADYYEFVANTTILQHSCKYLTTAILNQKVVFTNYKIGISSIADVIIANRALVSARIQLVEAKTNFLTALANLAYDTGGLSGESISPNQLVNPTMVETSERLDVLGPCDAELPGDEQLQQPESG